MANATRKSRRNAMAVAAAAIVPLMAFPLAGPTSSIAAAEFAYFPSEPTRVLTLSLLPGGNDDDLSGVMCESPRTCTDVLYSRANSAAAVATLNQALRDGTTGKQIVFAYSQGARVAGRWLTENAGAEGAPTAQDLSFVLMGNPSRKYGGSDRDWETTFPETEYRVIDVSQQYDMASDFPDNPFNLLALLNANAGFFFTHQDYETVDIYDEANYVWVEGNTTYVFVPTENLPLLKPLRWVGLGFLADALNAPLKEIVERAYDRSYLPAQPGLPADLTPEPELLQGVSNDAALPVTTRSTALPSDPVTDGDEILPDESDDVLAEEADEEPAHSPDDEDSAGNDTEAVENDDADRTDAGTSDGEGEASDYTGRHRRTQKGDVDAPSARESSDHGSDGGAASGDSE
ncbi:PE-PPE domain-containing protein [Mycolicibacterium sp. BiH015]|uniref:PE-PPE domain-containing protein n=1 Tax=Mycolicibacterium sp. BiH015 TaxID=3018808 RepID=UPI0022DF4714|nr:PE-PPE domain-containing protein [Mycolicibacterium sp. BiH015]MDA2893486.1 PE-PPE domain-containing protein [Mycolicibacterium sp. BiH015]